MSGLSCDTGSARIVGALNCVGVQVISYIRPAIQDFFVADLDELGSGAAVAHLRQAGLGRAERLCDLAG